MNGKKLWVRQGFRHLAAGLLAEIMVLSLTACGGQPSQEEGATDGEETGEETVVTFTDDLDREVTVKGTPQRAAALIGSFADVWCLAGGQETLVAAAEDSWTQFELDLDQETVANLGEVKSPNVETLLAAEPDFVLGSTKTAADVEMMNLLEELGIPVAYFDISSFADYLRMLEICTQLTGCPENYEQYGTAVEEQVEAARSRAQEPAPQVLYIRATGSSCKVKNSQNTVLGEMLADLGCVNIADSETGLLENLSLETIVALDPEWIFVVIQGSDPTDAEQMLESTLLSNPAWEGLTAVQEGRYHVMDQRLYNVKPNARWGEAYEKLADILYPEQ